MSPRKSVPKKQMKKHDRKHLKKEKRKSWWRKFHELREKLKKKGDVRRNGK